MLTALFILLSFVSSPGFSQSFTCQTPFPAHRKGSDGCWVEIRFDQNRRICLTRATWKHILDSSSPFQVCEDPSLPWKPFFPLRNSLDPAHPKQRISLFQYQKIRTQPPQQSVSFSMRMYQKWARAIEQIREETSIHIEKYDSLGILRSLVLNEAPQREPLPVFRKLGFVHLVSATGIHLYALADWTAQFTRFLTLRLRLSIRTGIILSRVFSILVWFSAWLLCGLRLGMIRPWIIILLREWSSVLGFRWKKASPLILSILIDLGISAVFHSFGKGEFHFSGRIIYALSVGGGLFWHESMKSTHWSLAVGSWILVALLEGWHTSTVALATPLLSLITLPIACLSIYPIFLFGAILIQFGFTSPVSILFKWIAFLFNQLILYLGQLAVLPGNLWMVQKGSILVSVFLSTSLMILKLNYKTDLKKMEWRVICITLCLFIFLIRNFLATTPSHLQKPHLQAKKLEQLDVGQGDSALISGQSTGLHVGLIDTGPYFSLRDSAWIELFSKRGISKIHWVALSHLDEDHSGGLKRLADLIPIQCVATPSLLLKSPKGQQLSSFLKTRSIPIYDWNSKKCIPFPTSTILPVQKQSLKRLGRSMDQAIAQAIGQSIGKNNSIMGIIGVPLQSGGFYLSAGDANAKDELRIKNWILSLNLSEYSPKILKVSHHGSATSTSSEWIRLTQADEAWISAGNGNRYGHPSPKVVQLLREKGVKIKRTDTHGILVFE